MHQRPGSKPMLAALLMALTVLGVACGAERAATPAAPRSTGEASYPLTVTADNGPVTLPAKPMRIVSLSPTATEMLYAIGAGDQVTAVDSNSNYPPGVPTTKLSAFTPNLEAILGYKPDLVVASDDVNGLVRGLETAKVTTTLLKAVDNLDGTYRQLNTLGSATGHTAAAEQVVTGMHDKVKQIVADAPKPAAPPSYYYELDPTLYSATSTSFVGSLFAKLGLRNIADAVGGGNAYPQLSAEFVTSANPDIVFLADTKCCGANPASYAARPGNAQSTAVATKSVIPLDDDIASRWGPRSVDLLSAGADVLKSRPAR